MQRSRGVRGHELDLHTLAPSEIGSGVVLRAGFYDLGQHAVQPRARKPEIDEPGPGDLNSDQIVDRRGLERDGKVVGNVAGRSTCRLRNDQRDIRGPVAVLGAGRADELDLVGPDWDAKARESRHDPVGQTLFRGHWSPRMAEVPLACNLRSSEPS